MVFGIPRTAIAQYQDKRWVTRPRPYVDRLACVWLIRRFINPNAVIRYSHSAEPDEIAFEMKEAQFEHCGNLCTFEVMATAASILSSNSADTPLDMGDTRRASLFNLLS